MPRRITQRDIAREAGLSHVAVSLALRNHPSISEETKKRVRMIADKIGYSPDPMLFSLSAYRRASLPAAYQCNIAWLNTYTNPRSFHMGEFLEYYAGAVQRCRQLGYMLEEIHTVDFNHDPRSILRVLQTKGISGVVVAPCEQVNSELTLDLSDLSAVRIGYSYRAPLLHTVTNAQFRTASIAMDHLIDLGYRRIGLLLAHDVNTRTGWNFMGGFAAASDRIPKSRQVPPLRQKDVGNREEIGRWLRTNKVDCVLGQGSWAFDVLKDIGNKIPADIGYADLALSSNEKRISGMRQNSFLIGVAAIDQLNNMLMHGERGVPRVPMHCYVEGEWFTGETVSTVATPRKTGSARPTARLAG